MNINFTLVMQAVAFAAFIWFTSRFVWPHLMRALDLYTRAGRTADVERLISGLDAKWLALGTTL